MRTCQVGVVRRVDEVVRQGEAHIFRLVQLLWRDDSILIAGQIAGEALKGDNTCTQNETSVLLHHARRPDIKVLALLLGVFCLYLFQLFDCAVSSQKPGLSVTGDFSFLFCNYHI